MMRLGPYPVALAISAWIHGLLLGVVLLIGDGSCRIAGANPQPDRWAGDTFEVDTLSDSVAHRAGEALRRSAERDPTPRDTEARVRSESAGHGPPEKSPSAPRQPLPTSTRGTPRAIPSTVAAREEGAFPPGGSAQRTPGPGPAEQAALGTPRAEPRREAGPGGPASAAASGDGDAQQAAGPPGGSSFGAAGAASSTRNLLVAFTRALPSVVTPKDRAWRALPVGTAGRAEATLTLDDQGRIAEVDVAPHGGVAPPLEGLIQRAAVLLKKGEFWLDPAAGPRGTARLELVVHLLQRSPAEEAFFDPSHVMARGYEAPTPQKPGHATFTYASGRQVRIEVTLLPPRP